MRNINSTSRTRFGLVDAREKAVFVVSALMVGVALYLFVRDHAYSIYDDAYIYLRYVKNIYAGCGLRFNCDGPPVEGFTGPTYLFSLVVVHLLVDNLVLATQIVGTISLAAALLITIHTAQRPDFFPERAWAPMAAAFGTAVIFAFDHYVLLNATVGMETPLAALVVVLLFVAVLRGNPVPIGVLLVIAFLSRPECALFVVALPMLERCRRKRFWVYLLIAFAAITTARLVIFKDIVPNTYWAKAGGTYQHFMLGLEYIYFIVRDYPVVLAAPLALLVEKTRREVLYFLVVTALWFLFFLRSGGDTFPYDRLAMPLVPTLSMLSMVGIVEGVRRLARRLHLSGWRLPALALLPALVFASYAHWTRHLRPNHGFENVERWAAVGRYLKTHFPGKTIATVPVGAISYYSGLDVIDLVGLVTAEVALAGRSVPPGMLTRNWIGHERHNTEWVLAQKPDVIVTVKFRDHPWDNLEDTKAGFIATWHLLRLIKEGKIPYELYSAPIAKDLHWLMFVRRDTQK